MELEVTMDAPGLAWQLELGTSPLVRALNMVHARLPLSTWRPRSRSAAPPSVAGPCRAEGSSWSGEAHATVGAPEEYARLRRRTGGFFLALRVLTYLTIVGLALPATVMTFGNEELLGWSRGLITVVFLSGVALLMRFLFVYARYLSSEHPRSDLPARPIGLVPHWRGADV